MTGELQRGLCLTGILRRAKQGGLKTELCRLHRYGLQLKWHREAPVPRCGIKFGCDQLY